MTRSAGEIGAGLLPARQARPIRAGERIHVLGAVGAGASAAMTAMAVVMEIPAMSRMDMVITVAMLMVESDGRGAELQPMVAAGGGGMTGSAADASTRAPVSSSTSATPSTPSG